MPDISFETCIFKTFQNIFAKLHTCNNFFVNTDSINQKVLRRLLVENLYGISFRGCYMRATTALWFTGNNSWLSLNYILQTVLASIETTRNHECTFQITVLVRWQFLSLQKNFYSGENRAWFVIKMICCSFIAFSKRLLKVLTGRAELKTFFGFEFYSDGREDDSTVVCERMTERELFRNWIEYSNPTQQRSCCCFHFY